MALSERETARRTQRLVARITDDQKKLFQRAADVEGRNLSDFVVMAVQAAATRAVQDHATIQLDIAASQAFVAEMLDPSPLPDRMRETIRLYRERQSAVS